MLNRFAAYKHDIHNVSQEYKNNIKSFKHLVFDGEIVDNNLFQILKIIPERLGAKNIYNIVCQLQINTGEYTTNVKHVDMPMHRTPYYSTVYYVNHSDAPTILYNKDDTEMIRCEPDRGKVIMFNGDIPHCSSKPKTNIRCIVNFCWD